MKKIFFASLLVLQAVAAFSQLDSTVNKIVDDKLNKFGATLLSDTVIGVFRGDGSIINADTLTLPVNTFTTFTIWLLVENTSIKEIGRAKKEITVRNQNGVYTLFPDYDRPYAGQASIAKATWGINLVGGLPVVQCTGPKATNVFFQITTSAIKLCYL